MFPDFKEQRAMHPACDSRSGVTRQMRNYDPEQEYKSAFGQETKIQSLDSRV